MKMKKFFMRKTSGLIASLMIVSMLLPIVAFAGFAGVTYDNSTDKVTGYVYVGNDVYDHTNTYLFDENGNIIVNVYDENGEFVKTITAVYGTYNVAGANAGDYYYRFELDNASSVDDKLNFSYQVADATYVSSDVYSNIVRPSTGGNTGGGGVAAPSGTDIVTGANGVVNAELLKNALADGSATIAISGNQAHLPASALTSGGTVTIVANGASYTLPTSELNLEELAKELGVEIDGLTITVTIDVLTGEAKTNVEAAATKAGGKVVGNVVDFKVEAVAGDKKVEVNNFNSYVSRTINYTSSSDVTGVLYDPATGKFSFVPATFSNGVATLKRPGNSIYTVIETGSKSFADLANHWSKDDVEKLASNLIVEGTGADKFEPTRAITRAEFAAMIVRALGLSTSATTDKFSDVDSSAWYAGAVAAAANAGIVNGDTAGTFRPSAVITRQELAAMVVRASKFAGKEVTLTDEQVSEALAAYSDADKLGWAKAEVAAAVSAGIVKGQSATSVAPLATSNRAEAATMVIRLLGNVGFLN